MATVPVGATKLPSKFANVTRDGTFKVPEAGCIMKVRAGIQRRPAWPGPPSVPPPVGTEGSPSKFGGNLAAATGSASVHASAALALAVDPTLTVKLCQ